MERFTGPYSLPKGSKMRVPVAGDRGSGGGTRGGFTIPSSMGREPAGRTPAQTRYSSGSGAGHAAGAYAVLHDPWSPANYNRAAKFRQAGAFLEQGEWWNPFDNYGDTFEKMKEGMGPSPFDKMREGMRPREWAKVGDETLGFYNMAANGFTLGCTGDPSISFPFHNIAVAGTTQFLLCAPVESANFGHTNAGQVGDTIPSGVANVAFPWGNTSTQFDGQNSEWWFRGSPTTEPIVFTPGTIVLPVEDPFPYETAMERVSTGTGARTRYRLGYETEAMSLTIPSKGPPVRNPNDVHLEVPPPRNEREEKHRDNTGRSVKQVYGGLTELKDVADCLEKHTKRPSGAKSRNKDRPSDRPCWGLPLHLKLKCLAENAEFLNVPAALLCIAENDLKDKIIGGTSGKATRNLNQNPYNPRRSGGPGLGSGGFVQRMR